MTHERIKPEEHAEKAPELRRRFWDIVSLDPDSVKAYAKRIGIPLHTLADFVFGRRILATKYYIKLETWILKMENDGK